MLLLCCLLCISLCEASIFIHPLPQELIILQQTSHGAFRALHVVEMSDGFRSEDGCFLCWGGGGEREVVTFVHDAFIVQVLWHVVDVTLVVCFNQACPC